MKDWVKAMVLVVTLVGILVVAGSLMGAQPQIIGAPPTTVVTGECPGFATATLSADSRDKYGANDSNVNFEIWDSSGQRMTTFNCSGYCTQTGAPTRLGADGYIMAGNDNFQGATDTGLDFYYKKVPKTWACSGTPSIGETEVIRESGITWTGYDDGSSEATTNITVDSGEADTTLEIKIAADGDACIGNPDFNRPLALVANATTLATWDAIRPASYDSLVTDMPDFLSGKNMVGDGYVLSTEAVCDYGTYKFGMVMDAADGQNPGIGVDHHLMILDKCYSRDDNLVWRADWADDSSTGTDTECGLDSDDITKVIYTT